MRLQSELVGANVPGAVRLVNKRGVVRFAFQFIASGGSTIVIFKFEDYPGYLHFCECWGDKKPLTAEEFFKVEG